MTDDQLMQIADRIIAPDFAPRLVDAKIRCHMAETEGRDIPAAEIAGQLGIPLPLFRVLMAWNIANASSRAIIDAMHRDMTTIRSEARH